jgi:hypothetical protein
VVFIREQCYHLRHEFKDVFLACARGGKVSSHKTVSHGVFSDSVG